MQIHKAAAKATKNLTAVNILVIVLSHHLPENKHLVIFAPVAGFFFGNSGTMLVFVPKLHDVEAAAVDVEVDVALLEIRRDGFPSLDFRVHRLNCLPSRLTDAFAVDFWADKQQFQFAFGFLSVDLQHHTADFFSIQKDAICLGNLSVDGVFNSGARDDFFAFFGSGVAQAKLLLRTVFKSLNSF